MVALRAIRLRGIAPPHGLVAAVQELVRLYRVPVVADWNVICEIISETLPGLLAPPWETTEKGLYVDYPRELDAGEPHPAEMPGRVASTD